MPYIPFEIHSNWTTDEQWKKGPNGCEGYIGDDILPSYIGIMAIYKDPY